MINKNVIITHTRYLTYEIRCSENKHQNEQIYGHFLLTCNINYKHNFFIFLTYTFWILILPFRNVFLQNLVYWISHLCINQVHWYLSFEIQHKCNDLKLNSENKILTFRIKIIVQIINLILFLQLHLKILKFYIKS